MDFFLYGNKTSNATHKLFIDEHTNIQYGFINGSFKAVGLIYDEMDVSPDFYNRAEVINISISEFSKSNVATINLLLHFK